MNQNNCIANINMREYKTILKYKNIEVLSLKIKYPLILSNNKYAQRKINDEITMQINDYFKYACTTLYNQAVKTYMDSLKNDFPFHSFDAIMEYNITYNENCFLSLYKDKYEYTGGAHGITIRSSDTWELCFGKNILLNYLFKPNTDFKSLFINESIKQVEKNLEENPNIYFDDYKDLIKENFNPKSYYLTPRGITIYFQQYDIAPYSTGIVEFMIPYKTIGWYPSCY